MIKTRLVGLLSHAKKYIVYTILWQWAALLSQVLAVFSIADLLERVVYRAVTVPIIERTILILVLVVVIRFVCERMGARSSYLACVDVKRILREKIYEKMLKLGASYSEQVSSSEVVQVMAEGVEQLETYFGKYLPQLFYSLIAPLTLFIILCQVSLKASVILLICVPLIPISIVVVQKIAKKLLNKYWSIYTGLGDSFLENLQGLTTLKIYQADQQKADEMDVESELSQDYHEGSDHAAQFHKRDGYCSIWRGSDWYGSGCIGIFERKYFCKRNAVHRPACQRVFPATPSAWFFLPYCNEWYGSK